MEYDYFKHRYVLIPDVFTVKGPKGDKGDKGDSGALALPLSSDDVRYRGNVLTGVLDELLYVPLSISYFTTGSTQFEKGQVLTGIQLSWQYNKTVQLQTITGTGVVSPSLLVGDRTKFVTLSSVITDTTITLTADDISSDAIAAKTAQINLKFLNKIYFGKRTAGTINDAFVLSLPSQLQSNRIKTFSVTTGVNEYIYFAVPAAYGAATFKANGFSGGFDLVSTFNFTNASGHTESYNVYQSTYDNLGLTFVEVA